MTTAISTHDRSTSRANLIGGAFALGLGTLFLGAAPAEARNDFKNGFEDELGRIVAHHVAAVSHAVLAPAVVVHREVHYKRPHYRGHRDSRWRGHGRSHYRGHGHYKRHHRHDRHHRSCGHTEVTVIKKHRRGGHHGDYARHDRRDRHDRHDRRGRRSGYDY